ncbi:GGDEF domain-containing protein [Salinisphaera sp.]|uniref:GGDEF domain-containing protein n=1 Tax=Salinisphaera sp. TaxID=1914330 RepID=UPI002D77CDF7|nr:diguanylate cyclase [Salinisphaera sp.]
MSAPRFFSGLVVLFGVTELAIWQLLAPWGLWPFDLITRIDSDIRTAIAILLLAVTFITALLILRRRVTRPLQDLAAYIALEGLETPAGELPEATGDTNYVANIRYNIGHLLGALKQQREALLQQTLNDPLTGLGNRRLLERHLDTLLPLSQRLKMTVSALMIDVDHFKTYNDHYGHLAGDDCLIEIANVLRDTFRRDSDLIVRLGGEEFLVVLADTDSDHSARLAEAMRAMLQLVGIPHEKSPVASVVTVSIGVATTAAGDDVVADLDTLISCADRCLYDCKTRGRNRIAHRIVGAAGDSTELIVRPVEDLTDEIFDVSA